MNRRTFLNTTLAGALAGVSVLAADKRPPRIVLRSSWQTVNIGDIGHTPGVLALLEKHIPEAEVTLWPMDVRNGVEEMLRRRFPKLRITKDKAEAFANDFLLHGSGPYLTAHRDVAAWRKETGKPYGVYGITMAAAGDPGMKIMRNNGLDDRSQGAAQRRELRLPARRRFAEGGEGRGRHSAGHRVRPGRRVRRRRAQ